MLSLCNLSCMHKLAKGRISLQSLGEVDTIFLDTQDNGVVDRRHESTVVSEMTLEVAGRTGLSSVTLQHFHCQVTGTECLFTK